MPHNKTQSSVTNFIAVSVLITKADIEAQSIKSLLTASAGVTIQSAIKVCIVLACSIIVATSFRAHSPCNRQYCHRDGVQLIDLLPFHLLSFVYYIFCTVSSTPIVSTPNLITFVFSQYTFRIMLSE